MARCLENRTKQRMKRGGRQKNSASGRISQLSFFASPLGEFAKEGLMLCLRFDPPGVHDTVLLKSLCNDIIEHCTKFPGDANEEESLSDAESLADCLELINSVLDNYDDWRGLRRLQRTTLIPLRRSEVNMLFEIRSVLRDRMLGMLM